jgi:hypothetical protein
MNCREAQTQIFAERDGALGEPERAALVSHVAACGDCRRIREDLASVLTHWKTAAQNVVVPDAEREWHAVRRKIRGGVEAGEVRLAPRRPRLLTWLTVPLAAVGALALALFISMPTGPAPDPRVEPAVTPVARAESVEVRGRNASTMVYVDDKSGWLIVAANDIAPKRG